LPAARVHLAEVFIFLLMVASFITFISGIDYRLCSHVTKMRASVGILRVRDGRRKFTE